ncbi:MAG: DNA-binding protein [Nitrosomonas sp.]|nr:DNA-binding protein [Nitrosomonas sp.]MBK7364984.1 DNA-binding protein [Nitrosomonas sp.]
MGKLKTADEVKSELKKSGITVSKWAMQNNLPPSVVYGVLRGYLQGNYGDSHRAAVLLGIKDGVIE